MAYVFPNSDDQGSPDEGGKIELKHGLHHPLVAKRGVDPGSAGDVPEHADNPPSRGGSPVADIREAAPVSAKSGVAACKPGQCPGIPHQKGLFSRGC